MKKKNIKKTVKENKKCYPMILVLLALVLGGVIGYVTHYTIVNWNGFFATCPDGNRPDKNGCCAGEVYTDAGDGWMVCCPDGGNNCFPPMK